MASLAGRANTDIIELPKGRHIAVGALRKIQAAQQRALAAPKTGSVFAVKPAASGMRLSNKADFAAALKLSDNQTVQLPSGRTATAGQVKALLPEVERRLGHKLDASGAPAPLTGPTYKISNTIKADEWRQVLRKPTSTILENQRGKKITVGELNQLLSMTGAAPSATTPATRTGAPAPTGSAPTGTPPATTAPPSGPRRQQ